MNTRKITAAVGMLLVLVPVGIGVLMLLLSVQANSKGRGSQSVTPVVAATPYASSAAPTKLVSCQSSQSVTPVIAATPSASSPGPTKLVSWPPTISAEEAQKGRLATELDYLLREQPGLVIAHEENNKVADPLVQCYQIEEVSLGRSVQFAVSGPSLCYCDEISIIPPELVKERTLITISKVWRITINGGPFPAGANYWGSCVGNRGVARLTLTKQTDPGRISCSLSQEIRHGSALPILPYSDLPCKGATRPGEHRHS